MIDQRERLRQILCELEAECNALECELALDGQDVAALAAFVARPLESWPLIKKCIMFTHARLNLAKVREHAEAVGVVA